MLSTDHVGHLLSGLREVVTDSVDIMPKPACHSLHLALTGSPSLDVIEALVHIDGPCPQVLQALRHLIEQPEHVPKVLAIDTLLIHELTKKAVHLSLL